MMGLASPIPILLVGTPVTLGRVWMEAHDQTTFKQVWEELRRLVAVLIGWPLLFKGLHVHGTILGLNADMEVPPLLGFADAFLPTIDRDELRGVFTDAGTLLLYVLRLCYTHIFRGIPEALHLSKDDHDRIQDFVHLDSSEAIEDFKVWITNIPDPDGAIASLAALLYVAFGVIQAAARPLRGLASTWAKAQAEAELKQATAEAKSNSSGRVPRRRPSKAKNAEETNTHGKLNAKQTLAPHRGSSRVASLSEELEREDIQEDEREVAATTPKPKRRKAGDPLAGWAIELVPGDKTTVVTPREYAQKEPEEFTAQYPQYVKFL
ncbi:hypothetical protein B0H19DRAFT_1253799 [Mycena capillaripes]|nr:hypothetical protein B0H19DRAFT_1253799 [Mycena capillaripes]